MASRPTPEELGGLAARCGIDSGSLEGKAIEIRIELLVQTAARDSILVSRLRKELPIVFQHLNRGHLERIYSSRPPSILHDSWIPSTAGSARPAAGRELDPSAPGAVNLLLIVATEVEREAVLTTFEESGRTYVREFIGVNSCWIYPSETIRVALVQCQPGTGGPGGSALTATESITALAPEAVIMPGIAFGVDPQTQRIGDVLLSTQILSYELRRMGTGEAGQLVEYQRGSRPDASPRLLDRFISARLARFGLTVKPGLLLSGDKLVDNIDYRLTLQSLAPEAIGGEMEGAGIYAAAHRASKEWILVKAVCDFADGNKRRNKTAR